MERFSADLGTLTNEVIAITGTGGKTTLMFSLARQLSKGRKVLATTTTKIMLPSRNEYDRLYVDIEELKREEGKFEFGLVVAGGPVNSDGKLTSISDEDLGKLLPFFDTLLIEADGSRMKKLKAWRSNEPVVPSFTSKTIGIIPITCLGMRIDGEHIHNFDLFGEFLSGEKSVTMEVLKRLVLSRDGLFKNSTGERILVINQADDQSLHEAALKLSEMIEQEDTGHLISKHFILSLEAISHGDYSHYTCRRLWQADERK
ncbi:selenium cofactor biosynthesis protein YqeC [Youngiibacter multivorans]|uniref:Selenium-dependent hydroxylase accessory protein YqeC n=1 Tax=Youngiibacter multivorans TaxID=937251 RepID=A0ABS4G3V7_9CLOT|nr:selenium cofactor biosynthesis protein YqeC [Youngiibacter multivorans]MBP1919227.1 putative selenium-dependent hydroxylase accessory protein YqeC [Youngiibacter multivorans]